MLFRSVVALSGGKIVYDGNDPAELGDDWQQKIYAYDSQLQSAADSSSKKPWGRIQLGLWALFTLLLGIITAWIGSPLDGDLGQQILAELRLPRAISGMVLGAVLAGAGAVLQILLQNPLATPGTVGTTAGASLGVIVALLLGAGAESWGVPLLPFAAFVGALVVTTVVVLIAARNQTRTEDVLLAGIALTLMTGAISSALRLGFDQVMALDALRWSLGSLTLIGFDRLWLALPFLLISIIGMLALLRPLDVLVTGTDRARSRGVDIRRVRTLGVGLSSLGVAEIGRAHV